MLKKILSSAALVLLATSSFAADNAAFYAGADVGSSKIDNLSGRNTSFGGFGGYQINENFSVEAGYRRFASFDVIESGYKVGAKLNQASLSAIGTLPLANDFNVFARLGYNRLEAKATVGSYSATASTSKVLLGFGMGYNIAPNVGARIEFQRPSSDSTNISAGVFFKF